MLVEMDCPFFLQFWSWQCRKIVHGLKNGVIELYVVVQAAIVDQDESPLTTSRGEDEDGLCREIR